MATLLNMEGISQRVTALKRFVLLIGDAGAVLARLSGSHVESHAYMCGTIEDNVRQVKAALDAFPRLPVVILFDVLGQAYRRDRLPPVNMLDRPKIMARKLETLFPGTELKGGLRLGVSEGELRGFDYLFAAVTPSPEVTPWQKMLAQIENPVSDVRLLPVESVQLLQRLMNKSKGTENRHGQWNILISQHRTGGFRQIVTRDHRLAIARMTSGFVDIDSAQEIISLLQREIGATIDYITRLGFDRAEGLNAIFVGREDIGAALKNAQLPVRNLTVMNPAEAEIIAGVSGTRDDSGHFADLLHAAWGGSRVFPALSLWPLQKRRQRMQTLGQTWGTRALAAASVVAMIYGANLAWNIHGAEAEYIKVEAARAALQQAYDAEVSKLGAGPIPISSMREIITIHQQLTNADVDLTPLFTAVGGALSDHARLSAIKVQIDSSLPGIALEPPTDNPIAPEPEAAPVKGTILLTLDLSSFRNAEHAVGETDRLANVLTQTFSTMQTTVISQPLKILPADTFSVKSGENVLAFTGEKRVAEIKLSGRFK